MRFLLVLGALAAFPAVAQPVQRHLSATDFLVDGADLIDKRVAVSDCRIVTASTSFLQCSTNGGSFMIDSTGLDKETLRRAIKACSSVLTGPQCQADVYGTAFYFHGKPGLRDAVISWGGRSGVISAAPAPAYRRQEPSQPEPCRGRMARGAGSVTMCIE
ncbi:hypothetical protein [Methylocystis parvus]|uniref:hypothetical protein n=1 Tax=Methylocystis parvus TaxID=134 RepID=UPI003C72110C